MANEEKMSGVRSQESGEKAGTRVPRLAEDMIYGQAILLDELPRAGGDACRGQIVGVFADEGKVTSG